MNVKQLDELGTSLFCRDMAMMLASGALPDEALELLTGDAGDEPRFSAAVQAIAGQMQAGEPFARAAAQSGVLPAYAVGMIAAGETAGRTEQVLERLADYYERQNSLRRRLRSAMVYPLVLLVLMSVVLAFLVGKVVPVFIGVYESLAGSLAGSAYAYAAVAQTVSLAALFITLAVCGLLLVGLLMQRSPEGAARLAGLLEEFPPTATASRLLAVARLTDALATFTASGLDTDTALREAAGMVTHKGLQKQLAACRQAMAQGEGLAQALAQQKVYTPLYGRMLQSGSRSGKLDVALARLAQMTSREAEDAIYAVIEAVEPVLTGFLTVAVGVALLAAMLPLVGILGSIG